jgi:phosphinothricin acetyltransferase
MSVMIRDAAEEDLPFLLKIYGYYVENTGYSFEYTVPSEEDFLNRFKTITEAYPWLVLLDEGKITGYAYASRAFQRAAYQWDADVTVYLDNTCHRKGYASLLYEKLLAILDIQGYYTVYAGITDINLPSLSFHQSKGFTEIGHFRQSGFKNGSWLGVIWMEKKLRICEGKPAPTKRYQELSSEVRLRLLHV